MWNYTKNRELLFQVYIRGNQLQKYLSKESKHTHACFKVIPTRVIKRLAKQTSGTKDNENKKIDKIYPVLAGALCIANTDPNFLTLSKACNNRPTVEEETESKGNKIL